MYNTPTLQTERLLLRRFTSDDIQALFSILNDREANRFLPWFPLETVSEAERYLQEHILRHYEQPLGCKYAICLKTDRVPIGYIHMTGDDSHDFGYALRTEYWHKGITTEAAKTVVAQLKKEGCPYITATHDVKNPRSGEVMKKLGMAYCYSYTEQWQPKDILVTFRMYQLNLDGHAHRVYRKYWDTCPHCVEQSV